MFSKISMMFRTAVKALIVLVVVLLFTVNRQDVALSSDATSFAKYVDDASESEAFIYHTGIFAPAHLYPEEVGRDIYTNAVSVASDEYYEEATYPYEDRLPLPDGDLFCHIWSDSNCIAKIFTKSDGIDTLKKQHKIILARVDHFYAFKEYKTMANPGEFSAIPLYSYFPKAERIHVLQAINLYRSGESTKAINLLYNRLSKVRNAFSNQDQLIGKLIFLAVMNELLDIASIILSDSELTAEELSLLTVEERNLTKVAATEFGYPYYNLTEEVKTNTRLPTWLMDTVFKPNMTLNAVTHRYTRLARLSTLNFTDLAFELMYGSVEEIETSLFKNPVGYIIASESHDFGKYPARISDFNAKINLFNSLYHQGLSIEQVRNPYFLSETTESFPHKACFNGLTGDERTQCLKISIDQSELSISTE